MSPDRAHELWTKHLAEGELLPEEEQELAAAFRSDPALAEQLMGDLEIDGLLRGMSGKPEEADASAQRFLDVVRAEDDSDRFVGAVASRLAAEPKRVTRRATHRKSVAPAPFPWRDLAVAAGVLVAIGLVYLLLRPEPAAPSRRPIEIVRPPEPKPEPTPEPVPPPPVPEAPKPAPREPEPVPPPAPAPQPPPAPKPAPAPVKAPEKVDPPPARTVTTVATLDRIEGEVFLISPEGRSAARAGDVIPANQAVETAKGSASLKFPDGTRVDLGADTQVREIAAHRMMVARGSLSADVAKQTADQPLVFATPHGEARVLGTSLRLDVGKTTRLEVREGKVRLTRGDGKKVDVAPGQFAVAGPGTDLVARPLSAERRILYQWDFDGPNAGADWQMGTIDRTQTFGGSRGALKAAFRPDENYAVHATPVYSPKPMPVAVNERTSITFAYFISAPVELKVQMRADRTKNRMTIAHIIPAPKAGAWTVVTLKLSESFFVRAGLGDPVKPGITELDDLQFHAGPDGKPVDLLIDNVAIFE